MDEKFNTFHFETSQPNPKVRKQQQQQQQQKKDIIRF